MARSAASAISMALGACALRRTDRCGISPSDPLGGTRAKCPTGNKADPHQRSLPRWVINGPDGPEIQLPLLPPEADIRHARWDVRVVPTPSWQELSSRFAALVGAAMCSACRCGSHDRWP